jgi:hypothetical protein
MVRQTFATLKPLHLLACAMSQNLPFVRLATQGPNRSRPQSTPSFGYFWDGCARFPRTLKRNRLAVVIPMLM